MPFSLDRVVPWGRTLDEYRRMFALSEEDLASRVLGCGDGPASFNASASAGGGSVVSCDPLYLFTASEIEQRVQETYHTIMRGVEENYEEFIWGGPHSPVRSPQELGEIRLGAMRDFLSDYAAGGQEGRYVAASLPHLPFCNQSFDLALCSHFLFLYSPHFDLDFHCRAVREMLRVATEVRIFPLLQLGSTPSPHVEPLIELFHAESWLVERCPVPYEFQKGGGDMLCLRHPESQVI